MINKNNIKKQIKESQWFTKNPILSLIIIGCVGLLIRLHYTPFDLPIILDGFGYFQYAIDISILGHLPSEYAFPNNTWPTLLSAFFWLAHSDNFLDYMNLQRLISVLFSALTVVPVYYLCKKFFNTNLALLGSILFIFDPRIILNSTLGITEPIFIFLGTLALVLFMSKNFKLIYVSFGIAALFALIRYEGLLLIIPLSVMFFIRFRKSPKNLSKYIFAITIFILVLLPMAHLRNETIGSDGLTSHVLAGPEYIATSNNEIIEEKSSFIIEFMHNGIINSLKYLGWVSIPYFVFLIPFGIILILKNIDHNKMTLILAGLFMLMPAFYAYGRDIEETRYLLVIFPIFCILSLFTVNQIMKKLKISYSLYVIIIGIVIVSSIGFVESHKIDYQHEIESYQIAKYVVKHTKVINDYMPEASYIRITYLEEKFPTVYDGNMKGPLAISVIGYGSLEEFISKNQYMGLDHIIVDKIDRTNFLNEVYFNENNYPYLEKIFESSEHGLEYNLKIFKINYDKFKELNSE